MYISNEGDATLSDRNNFEYTIQFMALALYSFRRRYRYPTLCEGYTAQKKVKTLIDHVSLSWRCPRGPYSRHLKRLKFALVHLEGFTMSSWLAWLCWVPRLWCQLGRPVRICRRPLFWSALSHSTHVRRLSVYTFLWHPPLEKAECECDDKYKAS